MTFNKQAPNHDAVEPNGSNTRVCRVLRNLKAFEFDGSVDKKSCILKIDSGSDVTILNSKFVEELQNQEIKFFKIPQAQLTAMLTNRDVVGL